jgi:hypothetical protein
VEEACVHEGARPFGTEMCSFDRESPYKNENGEAE